MFSAFYLREQFILWSFSLFLCYIYFFYIVVLYFFFSFCFSTVHESHERKTKTEYNTEKRAEKNFFFSFFLLIHFSFSTSPFNKFLLVFLLRQSHDYLRNFSKRRTFLHLREYVSLFLYHFGPKDENIVNLVQNQVKCLHVLVCST